jgi:molybdate transport repressor ModE-like protein
MTSIIKRVPEGAYVALDVGFLLTALVTQVALEQLEVRRGAALFAIVKANAIIPQAGSPSRFKIALIGGKGDVSPREIQFLRAIERTGSMSAASREMGVTYRTAWMWVKGINRAWGSPLVARIHGGRGGGGTSLTPEGRAALNYAAAVEAMALKSADRRGK